MFFWACEYNQLEYVYSHSKCLLVLSHLSCKLSSTFICQSHQLKLFFLPRNWPSKPVKTDLSDKAPFVCFTQCLVKTLSFPEGMYKGKKKKPKRIGKIPEQILLFVLLKQNPFFFYLLLLSILHHISSLKLQRWLSLTFFCNYPNFLFFFFTNLPLLSFPKSITFHF